MYFINIPTFFCHKKSLIFDVDELSHLPTNTPVTSICPIENKILACTGGSSDIFQHENTPQQHLTAKTLISGVPVHKKVRIFSDRIRYGVLDSAGSFEIRSILSQEVLKVQKSVTISDNKSKSSQKSSQKSENSKNSVNQPSETSIFEKLFSENDTATYVPQWINIDFRLGRPTMVLENSNFQSAWVYFNDQKENLGVKMARILYSGEIEDLHVFYSSANGKTITQRPAWFSSSNNQNGSNNQIKDPPKQNFYLREAKYEESDLEELRMNIEIDLPSSLASQNCLSGQNTLQVSKIAEHVHSNFVKNESSGEHIDGVKNGGENGEDTDQAEAYKLYTLTCNGKKLFRDADLRTVYHYHWTSQGKTGIPIIYWKKNLICSF